MHYPEFYDAVPSIALYDPLSDFLGAFDKGEVTVNYLDCVKLAGHSCPTVAGAYLMTIKALSLLYPDTLPERGAIRVEMRDDENSGVTGVIGNIASFIVGASGKGGFQGIMGRFARNDLVSYGIAMQGEISFTRTDTQQRVSLSYDPSCVPGDPTTKTLMAKALQGKATDEERQRFGALWQSRVEKILLSQDLWDKMITVHAS